MCFYHFFFFPVSRLLTTFRQEILLQASNSRGGLRYRISSRIFFYYWQNRRKSGNILLFPPVLQWEIIAVKNWNFRPTIQTSSNLSNVFRNIYSYMVLSSFFFILSYTRINMLWFIFNSVFMLFKNIWPYIGLKIVIIYLFRSYKLILYV